MKLFEPLIDALRTLTRDFDFGGFSLLCVVLSLVLVLLLALNRVGQFIKREWTGSIWSERTQSLLAWLDGLARQEPKRPAKIRSPSRGYQVVSRLATGDACDVHYALNRHRPYVLKTARTAIGDELLIKECKVLNELLEAHHDEPFNDEPYLPWPVETFQFATRQVTAFHWRKGFYTAEAIRKRYPRGLDGRHIAWMFKRTLEALGHVHDLGWIHGAVLPPHLLFHADNHGLQLAGWTHAERLGSPLQFVPAKFKPWYPPECYQRRPATPATDIYLAAKSMAWLAGGDPRSKFIPKRVPVEIRQTLLECLADSPSSRPRDAWILHEEFSELLEDVYGPPRFCHLEMS